MYKVLLENVVRRKERNEQGGLRHCSSVVFPTSMADHTHQCVAYPA